jgi:phthalate 4,5-cis-dihydrodiol dehydrogenase
MKTMGIVGLGRASTSMLPSILSHPEIELVGLCEPQEELRSIFTSDFEVTAYQTIEELCADPSIEIVYIATPHQFHCEHVLRAVEAGKHVLVEKPMALELNECDMMIEAARSAGVVLLVGHTNGFDPPILAIRELVRSERFGRLRMINTMNYNDFIYRPRRPEELDTAKGGGIMFNQFPHQVEMVRTITESPVTAVSAVCGQWDATRPTEGATSALIRFANGVVASLVYSGYAHLDVRQIDSGLDGAKDGPATYAGRRAALRDLTAEEEEQLRARSGYPQRRSSILSNAESTQPHERFGVLIASFEHADVVPSPGGLIAYTDETVEHLDVAFGRGGGRRATVLDELCAAIDGIPPTHDGEWARTSLEVCLAALKSSLTNREVPMTEW